MRIAAIIETAESHTTTVRNGSVASSQTHSATKPMAAPLTRSEDAQFDSLVNSIVPCRNGDPELWFAEQAPQMAAAKALCQQCPLAAACLSGALEREEPWGVWGGKIIVDGKIVAQKRGRGRPRKIEVA